MNFNRDRILFVFNGNVAFMQLLTFIVCSFLNSCYRDLIYLLTTSMATLLCILLLIPEVLGLVGVFLKKVDWGYFTPKTEREDGR